MVKHAQTSPKRRALTWRRVLVALAVLGLMGVTALMHVAGHLETPWLRYKVILAVREATHLEIDYGRASLGLDGLDLHDLTLKSPPEDRDLAPELLRVDELKLRWRLRDLLPGGERRVNAEVVGVALNVVVDARGETSLQRLLASLPPSPKRPLSQLFGGLTAAPALRVEPLEVAGIHARLTRRLQNPGKAYVFLGDLTLSGAIVTGPKAALNVQVNGGPLQLETTNWPLEMPTLLQELLPWLAPLKSGTGVLPLTLTGTAKLADNRLKVAVNLAAEAQPLLDLDAEVAPQPGKHGLEIAVARLGLLDATKMAAQIFVDDAMTLLKGKLKLSADLPAVKTSQIDWQGGTAAVQADGLQLALDPSLTTLERLQLTLDTPGLTVAGARVGAVQVRVGAGLSAGVKLMGDVSVTVAQVAAELPAGDVTATAAEVDLHCDVDPMGVAVTAHVQGDVQAESADGRRALRGKLISNFSCGGADLATLRDKKWAAMRFLTAHVALQPGELELDGEKLSWDALGASLQLPSLTQESPQVYGMRDAGHVEVQVDGLRGDDGKPLVDKAFAAVTLADAHLDLAKPLASTGHVNVKLVGPVRADGDFIKGADDGSWNLQFDLGFGLVNRLPWLAVWRKILDWTVLTLNGHTVGTATHLSGLPVITQDSTFSLTNLKLSRRADVRKLEVKLKSDGRGLRQIADFSLNADIAKLGPLFGKLTARGKIAATGHLDHDPAARKLDLKLDAKGPNGLDARLALQGHAHGADLAYVVHAQARKFVNLLGGLDRGALCLLDPRLAAQLDATGTLTGAARIFAQKLPAGIDGHHALTLGLTAVSCRSSRGTARFSKLAMTADGDWQKGLGHADVRVTLPNLDATLGGHVLRLDALQQHVTAELRDDATLLLAADGKLARLTQDALPTVPLRDLSWTVRGWSGPQSARLELLQVDNPPTGTRLTLTGGLDRASLRAPQVTEADLNGQTPATLPQTSTDTSEPVPGRVGLNLVGELRQDLGALAHDNADFSARGTVTVPIHLESGDLSVFRLETRVQFDHVDVAFPKATLEIHDIFGDMPLAETFTLTPSPQLLGGGEDDAYTRWRFSEHQPLLQRSDFLTIGKIVYRDTEFGPIAGNASVDRDVFRMDQLEAALLRGQLTGQCMVLLNGDDTHVQLRGDATGLQVAGSDERFDANMALDFLPARRSLDGRAEILHMGRKHLESLLNLWDPYGEDARMNKLRTLLKFGHPERVRMRFSNGFMDVGVDLGGLAGAVQIEDLRGIALGPMFERWLDPLLDPLRELRVREASKP